MIEQRGQKSAIFKPGTPATGWRAWFLKIDPVRIVGMGVCLRLRVLMTSGVMWRDMDLI